MHDRRRPTLAKLCNCTFVLENELREEFRNFCAHHFLINFVLTLNLFKRHILRLIEAAAGFQNLNLENQVIP